jgi:hypothetical protein
MPQLESNKKVINQTDMNNFKKRLNVDLPIGYEEFLLSSNGGYNQDEDSNNACLYNLAYGDTNLLEIIELVQEIENNLSLHFLIIGDTITGNLISPRWR